MLRKIVVILTLMLCAMATQLSALELGTVTVESALNQPLRMRVELLQLGDTRLQDIRVSMASSADFERFNINLDSFLSNIRFSVESTAQGSVVILTSSQIVSEPYLSFILDTRWPNGRLLGEYTIVLDLPVFNDQQLASEVRQAVLQAPTGAQATDVQPFAESSAAPSVTAPSSTSSAASLQPETAVVPDEVVEEESTVVEEEPVEEVTEAEPEVIEISSGDTLSGIAQQVRLNTAVSMQQTMMGLQELNPEAFANGNINRLRSGQVLRVPTLEEIQSIDPRDAVEEVLRQNQEFAEVDVQPLAAPSNTIPDQGDQPQGQLSVVSSDDAINAKSDAAELADAENETLDQRIAELETQLAQRSEEADRARIEREELDSRMVDLEAQIAAAEEIIRLQDIQLAQLQESLAVAAADVQLITDAAAAEAALPVYSPSDLTDEAMRILAGNSIFILFGIVLVILLLVLLMLRRNRAAEADNHELDEIAEQDFDADVQEISTEDFETGEAGAGYQDYDPADLDSELDDIIGVSDEAEGSEQVAKEEGPTEKAVVESDDVDMIFDLGGHDDAGKSNVEGSETETFEFDLDDDSIAVEGETKDSEGIDTLEFDVDLVEEVIANVTSGEDEEIEVETFSFDADAAPSVTKTTEGKEEDASPEAGSDESAEIVIDDEIEFDSGTDDEPEEVIAITDKDLTIDDDLEFLSNDDVEIESVYEVGMLSTDDETATKLELAYAYHKMGDMEGATEILQEVIKEGSDEQVEEASKLLGSLAGKSD